MTPEEAQRAYDEAPEVPLSDERIEAIVRYATGGGGVSAIEMQPVIDSLGRKCRSTFITTDGRVVRRCGVCKQVKAMDGFHTSKQDKAFGRHSWCKECKVADTRERSERKRYYLMKKFGMTAEQFEKLLVLSNGLCSICKEPFRKTPHVDHDHVTGKIRNLLCGNCNSMLGQAGDDPAVLRAGAEYLERHKS